MGQRLRRAGDWRWRRSRISRCRKRSTPACLKYLSDQLRGTAKDATGYGLSDRCLAVYTLAIAGKAEPAYHDLLFQKRAKLSAEDRALVALAVIESKGPKADDRRTAARAECRATATSSNFSDRSRARTRCTCSPGRCTNRGHRGWMNWRSNFSARRSNGHWSTTQGERLVVARARVLPASGRNGRRECDRPDFVGQSEHAFLREQRRSRSRARCFRS